MKIGIVVYSETGHTYSVAEKLQEKLQANGHSVDIERVTTGGDVNPGSEKIAFQNQPDVQGYGALVFGSPVHAFNLAPAMAAYLEQIQSLQEKKIACFVTKGLPFNWTGGNKAISKMKKICQSKGGTVVGTDIIIWRDNVDEKIEELIRRFSVLF
jgi:flavodoxin